MAVSFPLSSLPATDAHVSATIRRRSSVGENLSPWTFTSQYYKNQGQIWLADITLPRLSRADKAEWDTFLAKMNGKEGSVLLGDPSASASRGSAATTPGTPVINGASQTGQDININGLPLSATGYLLKDDRIQFGSGSSSRLHQVLEDVNTNGSGEATVTVWPDVHTAFADGSTVVVSSPVGLFKLIENESEFNNERNMVYDTPTILFKSVP